MDLFDEVKFNEQGLIPAIAQDAETGEVLMLAWMNREALQITRERKKACYYSRSRGKLWIKGETSGHAQQVREIRLDCDGDAVLLKVVQTSGACHEGYRSCFFRKMEQESWVIDQKKVFDPESIYRDKK
jgi:phosphoribosyl-AMP cyclohydrolase